MALSYSDLSPGTAVVWTNVGGDKAMNLKALATNGIREGAKSASLVDGTKGFPELLEIIAETKVQAAPTDGLEVEVYLGFSSNATAGTDNPGNLTGADAAVADLDVLPQLVYVGSVIMASSIGTGVQRQRMVVVPIAEFLIPVLRNMTGQTTSNVDGETKITVRPWYRRAPIA